MRLAVLGKGNVCGTLGRLLGARGHEVHAGDRDPDAEAVLLAAPWSEVREVLDRAGNLEGKILMDCTYPDAVDIHDAEGEAATWGSARIRDWAPGTRVVKAYVTLGVQESGPGSCTGIMFICGDDDLAKSVVRRLGSDLDFRVVDAGPLSVAYLLEPLATLWKRVAGTKYDGAAGLLRAAGLKTS